MIKKISKKSKIITGIASGFVISTSLSVGLTFGLLQTEKKENVITIKLNSLHYQYYKSIDNVSKNTSLISKISELISKTHTTHLKYKDLWDLFRNTDLDKFYKKDGKIIDIYSYSFKNKSNYKYNFKEHQCGERGYKKEGDCYNREHLVPQSFFKKKGPMLADAHHIYPTDGWVNNLRSNYDITEVKKIEKTTTNGSKYGRDENNNIVFEPIDEFKGNIARAYLYFGIRYSSFIGEDKWNFFTSNYPFIEKILKIYLKWHEKDPVDVYDIHRNENIFKAQHNRNPFVDIPELAKLIWNPDFATTKIKLINLGTN